MKTIIIPALLMIVASGAWAAEGDASAESNSALAQCQQAGQDSGLQGEDLQDYVASCLEEKKAAN